VESIVGFVGKGKRGEGGLRCGALEVGRFFCWKSLAGGPEINMVGMIWEVGKVCGWSGGGGED